MIIEKPGLYKDISNSDYHASPGISNTGLKVLLDCPRRYWYEYLSCLATRKEKKEYTLGTAVHTLILEKDTFASRYYLQKEKVDGRTTDGKAANAKAKIDAAGKIVLDFDDAADVLGMAESVRNHPKFKRVLLGGEIENSIMWQDPESGALLRTRPDYYNDFLITDLKTTSKGAAKNFFAKSIAEYGYHRQAAMACDGLSAATGREYNTVILFVVEESPPYLCVPYLIKDRAIELGRTEYKRAALLYQECLTSNYWPGYGDEIMEIDLPNWYYSIGDRNE